MVLATKIKNFSGLAERRIALNLIVNFDVDIEDVRNRIVTIMCADERVLTEPSAPLARVTTANATGISLTALCWTKNENFLDTQSDLWIEVVNAFKDNEQVRMALPQQEIHIVNEKTA